MVQAVDRTLDILEQLVAADDDMSVSELRDTLGLPLGTVHRLLGMLVKRGYAAQDPRSRRYGPGSKLLEIAANASGSERFGLQRRVKPHLERLTAATGETSNLVVPQGLDGMYLDQVASPHLVRMFTEIGRRAPLYCTGGGKAILAGFSERELDHYLASVELVPWTAHTITSPERLRADLAEVRECGYVVDDEEREIGVRCVAAPIFDQRKACVAAISISGPASRFTPDLAARAGALVHEATSLFSSELGFRGQSRLG